MVLQKRKLALLLTVIVVVWICWLEREQSTHDTHATIHSAYYFPESKSLGQNAIAIVTTIDRNYLWRYQRLRLIGRSSATGTTVCGVRVTIETDGKDEDFVTALIQSDGGMGEVDKLEIDAKDAVFEVPFQRISSTPTESVVFCYSPTLPISENWQHFLIQTRLSRHFRAHSHFYILGITEPFDALIRGLDDSSLTVQPWFQTEKSTNGAVFTDCLLQYKERTAYVAFLDSDDLMVPSGADSYYEEFMRMFGGFQMVTSLLYTQYQMTIGYADSWNKYSISRAIGSSKMENIAGEHGKLVVRTEMFNSTGAVFSMNVNTKENSRVTKQVFNAVYRLNPVEMPITRSSLVIPDSYAENIPLIRKYQLEEVENAWMRMKVRVELKEIGEKLPRRRYFNDFRKMTPSQPDDLQCLTSQISVRTIKGSISFNLASAPPSLFPASDCF